MRFGVVILPEHRWAAARPLWRRAEELGFDHVWTYDHLTWRSFRDAPWFGAIPTLTAAALATTRIRLGPLVTSPNFRHPLPLAKELVTLDDVSGGRLTVGVGAGGVGWDASMLGQAPWSPAERAARFEEFVDVLDLLLREPEVSVTGRFYSAHSARTHPGCVQQPRLPFVIAASGPKAMRVAARHGTTWVTTGDRSGDGSVSAAEGTRIVAGQIARLDEACAAVGRDPSTIGRMVLTGTELDPGLGSVESFLDTVGRYEAIGITDLVVHWPRPEPPYEGDLATFEAACSAAMALRRL
jgi:alkanesulfonate monooxygenase SsuD/methylene tetrahydromethanopterin reductase-like flavin-dependent oxidoreductase (luciferase family)